MIALRLDAIKVCMPPGIKWMSFKITLQISIKIFVCIRYSSKNFRLPKIVLFTPQTKHFFGDVYRNRQRVETTASTHITLTRKSYSNLTPSSNHGREYRLVIYPLAETYPIPEGFPVESRPGCMPPGFQSCPPESLALIRWMDWELMRHSLCEKTIQGWYYDYLLCVSREMKAGLWAWPLFLRAENTLL